MEYTHNLVGMSEMGGKAPKFTRDQKVKVFDIIETFAKEYKQYDGLVTFNPYEYVTQEVINRLINPLLKEHMLFIGSD